MMLNRFATRATGAFLVMASLASAPIASAQTLPDAERAHASHDDARAVTIAEGLLEEGTRAGAELGAIYRILGLARLGSGDQDGARTAMTRWLAFEPSGRIEGANDDVRSVLMEARGVWAATGSRLGATAELSPSGASLLVRISDPASMAARVRVRARVDDGAWVSTVVPPSPALEIAVAGLSSGTRVDYSLAFIDEFGNRVWLDGSDEAPLHLALPTSASRAAATARSNSDPTAFYVGGGALLALAVVGGVVGAITHAERERLAAIYDGDGSACTGVGDTRGARCGPELNAIATNEATAIAGYVVGGAALVAGLALFLAAPSGPSTTDTAWSCAPGPGLVGIACGGAF